MLVLIRGGGDLATGVAIRLIRSGLRVVITELPKPLAVRRTVSFSEAVYADEITVEGHTARAVTDPTDSLLIKSILRNQQVPVLVDPDCVSAESLQPLVIVDGCMTKQPPSSINYKPQLHIGLGPGFVAGKNCHAVIETHRSHMLGRVFWDGDPYPDTGLPEGDPNRVLRAPVEGELLARVSIGNHIKLGQIIAEIGDEKVIAPFKGMLRGLIHPGLVVIRDQKIGDLDSRDDPRLVAFVSDKALSIGGGVLEAILTLPALRTQLYT